MKCTCCRHYFASVSEMKEHRYQRHMDEIKCDFCDKIYTCPAEKKKHMQAKHNIGKRRPRYHKCPKCGNAINQILHLCGVSLINSYLLLFQTDFKIGNRVLLDVHMTDNCERILLFKCKLCGAAFDSERNVRAHRLTHDGNACEVCNKVYPTIAQLISHRKTHEDKLFRCEYCSKSFLVHAVYLKHLSAHTGINPYKCSTCSKRFLKSVERDSHEKNGCDQAS